MNEEIFCSAHSSPSTLNNSLAEFRVPSSEFRGTRQGIRQGIGRHQGGIGVRSLMSPPAKMPISFAPGSWGQIVGSGLACHMPRRCPT